MNLKMVSDRREHPQEASLKVISRSNFKHHVQKQAKLLKKVLRTDAQTHRQTFPIIILDLEASVNFSSRLTIRNPVKTPPVLEVSSWSLEELQIPDEPGDGVRQKEAFFRASVKVSSRLNIRISSRLHLSSKSLPHKPGDGEEHPQEATVQVLSRLDIKNLVKTPPVL